MHQGTRRRASRRRGAPRPPGSRKNRPNRPAPAAKPASGFEGLLAANESADSFFSGWLEPSRAADVLEHGRDEREPLRGDPRLGMAFSGALHVLIVLFLLLEPSLELLGSRPDAAEDPAVSERNEALVLFMEEPEAAEEPPLELPPLVAVVPEPPAPASPPAADDRILIPKALLAPPEEKVQDFMNDLPFSEGNTEEFYTDEEVKDPGETGEPEPAEPVEEARVARESGEDDAFAEEREGAEDGNDGTDAAEPGPTPEEVGKLLFGEPSLRAEMRPRTDIRPPPQPRPSLEPSGEGGENGAFTDIRRFLAGARFDNPEGGLVANTDNTLYYNDKGANFVPWIRRMIAEVRRNWFIPYSISFEHGHVAIGISVARNGTITDMKLLYPSGKAGFDNAAVGAIRAAQLLPLPSDYPDDQFDIILVFWYNERPYDIFG